jgi:hypothetical protein
LTGTVDQMVFGEVFGEFAGLGVPQPAPVDGAKPVRRPGARRHVAAADQGRDTGDLALVTHHAY